MAKLAKPKAAQVETAKTESKKELELKENEVHKLSPILALLRLILVNTLRVVGDIDPQWVDAILLLNHLTCKAPIASLTGNKEHSVIDDDAFKEAIDSSNGHAEVISMYEDPKFPDGEGKTYMALGRLLGMVEILELASMVMRRFMGQRGVFFDCVMVYPKVAFVYAVFDLLESHFIVDIEAIEALREMWYSNMHVTGADVKEWIDDNADMVRRHNIGCLQLNPPLPKISLRDESRQLIRNIETATDSTYDNALDKVQDALDGASITTKSFGILTRRIIKVGREKFPDTNSVATTASERAETRAGNGSAFMVSRFLQQRRMPINDGDAGAMQVGGASMLTCWHCGKEGHRRDSCPELTPAERRTAAPDTGKSKNLRGVNRNIEYRHDPHSKLTPAQQDEARKKRRAEWKPPTEWIEGKHSLCEHIINGKRCNMRHLRLHCTKFLAIGEDTTVGLVFEVDSRIDGPGEFQDGTAAWEFSTEDAPAAAAPTPDPEFDPFEPAVDQPPVVAAVPQPEATWSVDTVINLLALLLVMGLGCSLLVPVGERESEDDDVFYVGGHAGETTSGGLRSMALMCLLSFTSAVQSVTAGDVLTEACATAAMIAATAMAAAAVAVAVSANAVAAAEAAQREAAQQQVDDVLEARRLRGAGRAAGEFRRRVNRLPFGAAMLLFLFTCVSPVHASPRLSTEWREWLQMFESDVAQTQATTVDWSQAYLTIAPQGDDGMTAMLQIVIAAAVML